MRVVTRFLNKILICADLRNLWNLWNLWIPVQWHRMFRRQFCVGDQTPSPSRPGPRYHSTVFAMPEANDSSGFNPSSSCSFDASIA